MPLVILRPEDAIRIVDELEGEGGCCYYFYSIQPGTYTIIQNLSNVSGWGSDNFYLLCILEPCSDENIVPEYHVETTLIGDYDVTQGIFISRNQYDYIRSFNNNFNLNTLWDLQVNDYNLENNNSLDYNDYNDSIPVVFDIIGNNAVYTAFLYEGDHLDFSAPISSIMIKKIE